MGAAFYAFGTVMETVIEDRINELLGRRRMERSISSLRDHVVICGWGRVGRSLAAEVAAAGRRLVVIEHQADRAAGVPYPVIVGDATDDEVLRAAGIERAVALVAAVDGDASNSFITLSARALKPDLFIVSRSRGADSEDKLRRAGADRVVNPQVIGGARMAAFVLRPHVAEFLDVVMHEQHLEFRLEEVPVAAGSPIAGCSLRDVHVRDRTGALVLAPARRRRDVPHQPVAGHRDPPRAGHHRHRHPARARRPGGDGARLTYSSSERSTSSTCGQ